jgi:hypothetical protein
MQRGFLSVRKLLQRAGYNDFDLYYDELGNRTSKMTNTFPPIPIFQPLL